MFLKSLSIKGFKSFASPTRLDFEPGVTVVVGPNGSGKSNVVDAIAWVLGAQRPSAVRSQKMDDVIFAGTTRMKALGRAEVALTIDNTSKVIPIEFDEVTITRRLFRTGDSEYEINGVGCRLLDIQDLLSDSGVGRQQHVIISQGQIDAVLNARPEERRAIIEEAAGVLKYRRRKEKSERRLESTQANLTRLGDLLREVRRQLKPLERQAEAARRHGGLIGELTTLRVHLVGREIADLRERLQASTVERQQFQTRHKDLSRRLEELTTTVRSAELKLTEAGADDTGTVLARCESLRERLKGVDAVLAERVRSIDSDRQATADGAVISALEADREQIQRELADVDARETLLTEEAIRVADAEQAIVADREKFDATWSEDGNTAADEGSKVRGELAAHSRNLQLLEAERSRLVAKSEGRRTEASAGTGEAEQLRTRMAEIEALESKLIADLDEAEELRSHRQETHSDLAASLDAAREARSTWQARVEALTMALDEIRSRSGAQIVADVDGVLGPLLDMVEIDDGYETAVAAALGAAAHAVVVDSMASAEAAAAALIEAATSGLLLAVPAGTGVADIAVDSLRNHVRGRNADIDRLLDIQLGSYVVRERFDEAVRLAVDDDQARIVTIDGASFSPQGWRVGAERLAATGVALDEAQAEALTASTRVDQLVTEVAAAAGELDESTKAAAKVQAELNVLDDQIVSTGERLAAVQRVAQQVSTDLASMAARLSEIDERLDGDAERTSALEARLVELEADEQQQAEQLQLMKTDQTRIEEQTRIMRGLRNDIDVRTKAISDRRAFLHERLGDVQQRLGRHTAQTREAPEARLAIANDMRVRLSARQAELDTWISSLREQRQRQSDAVSAVAGELDAARTERTSVDDELRSLTERQAKRDVHEAEFTVRLESATETLRRDLSVEIGEAIRTAAPPLPEGMSASARVNELERELRIMGAINPLALEEFDALTERHDFLQGQLDDVKSSRRELAKVIRAIDDEIVQVFTQAYTDVATNFTDLFGLLFPGGTGGLTLTLPDDPLNTGIEVEARPSGKNVRKLSLLSGGERSLTALAFLFAVFRSRPSPFYVMDEVEAALDDVNLHRFLGLVSEFRDEAQLIIVSHQKRTMEAADCLYGVTMKPGESSRVVSERPGADMSAYVDGPSESSQAEPSVV